MGETQNRSGARSTCRQPIATRHVASYRSRGATTKVRITLVGRASPPSSAQVTLLWEVIATKEYRSQLWKRQPRSQRQQRASGRSVLPMNLSQSWTPAGWGPTARRLGSWLRSRNWGLEAAP